MQTKKEKAVICDIDGTLAHMGDRNPFDFTKVDQDEIDLLVRDFVVNLQKEGNKLILLTGREGTVECIQLTLAWLQKHKISFTEIYFRGVGNREPDYVVKHDLYRAKIEPYYDILVVFDDRPRVIEMWRQKAGLRVIDVGNGIDF